MSSGQGWVCEQQRRGLVSAFFIHVLECLISILDMSNISIFKIVSVAKQAGLSLILL